LEEEVYAGEGTKDRFVEHYVELWHVGIEKVQVCMKGICFEFREREECQGEDTHRVIGTLCKLNKECFKQVRSVHRTNTF
jgi:hypothetical protein